MFVYPPYKKKKEFWGIRHLPVVFWGVSCVIKTRIIFLLSDKKCCLRKNQKTKIKTMFVGIENSIKEATGEQPSSQEARKYFLEAMGSRNRKLFQAVMEKTWKTLSREHILGNTRVFSMRFDPDF